MFEKMGVKGQFALSAAAAILSVSTASHCLAGSFAGEVVSYDGGGEATYTNPDAALGLPANLVGDSIGFPNVLSPFSPAFEDTQIVRIAGSGELTLKLAQKAHVGDGLEIGVISNVGLVDAGTFPDLHGQNTNPASTFSPPGAAEVRVSDDGVNFISLGVITFDLPANYYRNISSPFATAPEAGSEAADFGKPFEGQFSDFDGLDWQQSLAALDGSSGGKWIDLSPSGLTDVEFIQFRNPSGPTGTLVIDSVLVSNAAAEEGPGPGPNPIPLPNQLPGAAVIVGAIFAMTQVRSRMQGAR